MKKSLFKVSALTAGLSAISSLAIADNMGLAIVAQFGMGGLLGSDGLSPYKTSDKNVTFNKGSFATVGSADMAEADVTRENALISEPKAGKDLVWDAGVRFSYDFGVDKDEMFGMELGARFFMAKHTATSKESGVAESTELATGVSLSGVAADLSMRILPVHFDGGYMLVTLGVDSRFNFVGKEFIAPQRPNNVDTLVGTDEQRNQAKEAINGMNFAPKLGIGANFVDEMIHVSLNARYWMKDQVERSKNDQIKGQDPAIARLSVGNGLDANLCVGFNMMPLFA